MSAGAWMICLVLVGQVGSGSGRYPAAGGTNPFSQGSSANANSGGSGLVPIIEPSQQGSRTTQGAAAPSGQSTNPYGPSSAPIGSGSGSTYPPPGAAVSPSGTNPWQTNPPAGGTAQSDTTGGVKPAAMMRAMLAAPRDSRLPGSSLSLADAVAGASSRVDQTERVEAYWDLCSSVADYYLGLREQEELRRLRTQVSRVGPTWQQAESELAVRIGTSQRAAVASQYRLASLMGRGAGSLPLPADIPHCGDYHSRYDQIFAGRPSAEAQELATLLPLRYAELKDATLAVTRAEQWLETTVTRSDNSDGVETLRALELLALRRRAFVQIARDYNRRIARYTELATPGQVASERLIGMLIKRDGTTTATRTSAPAPYNRQSQAAPSLPKTFDDEGWTPASGEKPGDAALDEAIKQASRETEADQPPRQERSLLVKPQ